MTHRINITLTEEQMQALTKLMATTLSDNRSAYIGTLIAQEAERKEAERNKRGVGRPRKEEDEFEEEPDYTNDLPKIHNNMGSRVGPRELADIQRRHKELKGLL